MYAPADAKQYLAAFFLSFFLFILGYYKLSFFLYVFCLAFVEDISYSEEEAALNEESSEYFFLGNDGQDMDIIIGFGYVESFRAKPAFYIPEFSNEFVSYYSVILDGAVVSPDTGSFIESNYLTKFRDEESIFVKDFNIRRDVWIMI